jgi:hypothetical protein
MWYVAQLQPGQHPTAPDTRTSFSTVSDVMARGGAIAAGVDFDARLKRSDAEAIAYHKLHTATSEFKKNPYFGLQKIAVDYELANGLTGSKTAAWLQEQLHKLIMTWSQPESKMVCLNDDLTELYEFGRPIVDHAIRGFLAARYSKPSQFELRSGRNGCK